MTRGTRVELRPAALAANAGRARQWSRDAAVYAMVKADGYGHGIGLAARAMEDHVDGFGVAVLEEALALRQRAIDKPVMLLEGFFDESELREAAYLNLEVVIHSEWQVALLEQSPRAMRVWLKVNTGMHRLGMPPSQVEPLLSRLMNVAGVQVLGLMTHFACADQRDDPLTGSQITELRRLAEAHGLPYSAANSAALQRYPDTHGRVVRPGIMLYGSSPFPDTPAAELGLSVTHRFTARIIALNDVAEGGSVGYGATWQAPRPSRVAVVSVGYGDGYPRHAPSGTPVAVDGLRASLVGRVSMDMITVDVTDLPQVAVGDEVELWGDVVSVDEVAIACGTISYELFCQVTGRPERVVVDA